MSVSVEYSSSHSPCDVGSFLALFVLSATNPQSEDDDATSDDHFAAIQSTLDSKREDISARIAGVEDLDLKERLTERFEFVDSVR